MTHLNNPIEVSFGTDREGRTIEGLVGYDGSSRGITTELVIHGPHPALPESCGMGYELDPEDAAALVAAIYRNTSIANRRAMRDELDAIDLEDSWGPIADELGAPEPKGRHLYPVGAGN